MHSAKFDGIPILGGFSFEVCQLSQPTEQPPNDFGFSDFERPIQLKLLSLLVPGGGVEPQPRIEGM